MHVPLLFSVLLAVCAFVAIGFTPNTPQSSTIKSLQHRSLVMKKGRKVPVQYKDQFKRQQEIMDAQMAYQNAKPKDVPIFRLYARGKKDSELGNPWTPIGELVGDQKSLTLVNAYMSGFLSDFYKSQIDRGVRASVYENPEGMRYANALTSRFKPFMNYTIYDVQMGYEIDYEPLRQKMGPQSVTYLPPEAPKNWIRGLQETWASLFADMKSVLEGGNKASAEPLIQGTTSSTISTSTSPSATSAASSKGTKSSSNNKAAKSKKK